MPDSYVLALRSYHADRIYRGVKTWEFRRVRANIPVGATVFIYESGGVGKITGEFRVAGKVVATPAVVAACEPNPRSRQDAIDYLDGAAHATGLHAQNVRRYDQPIDLADVGVPRAPQSYCRAEAVALPSERAK